MNCSSRTLKILQAAGWSYDRRIDSDPYRDFLFDRHFSYNDKADSFITQFGGLVVPFITRFYQTDELRFDLLNFPLLQKEFVEDDSLTLDRDLCLLGTKSDLVVPITMDSDGMIYSSTETEMYLMGSEPIEAIDRIIRHKPLRLILPPGA